MTHIEINFCMLKGFDGPQLLQHGIIAEFISWSIQDILKNIRKYNESSIKSRGINCFYQ